MQCSLEWSHKTGFEDCVFHPMFPWMVT